MDTNEHQPEIDWPKAAREAAKHLNADDGETTPVASLLVDIYLSFLRLSRERAFTRELVACLNGFGEREWSCLRRGQKVTEVWLSRQLREMGVPSKTVWIGETSAKGFDLTDFKEVFQRYLPKVEREAEEKANNGAQAEGEDVAAKETEPNREGSAAEAKVENEG